MSARVLPALVVTLALALSGCGSGADSPAAAETAIVPSPSAAAPASPAKAAAKQDRAAPAKPAATVAPEVVVPSTADIRSEAAPGGWQGTVVAQLRRIDPRLVTTSANAVAKVRATCEQMSTGMFVTRVVPVIVKRFSNAKLTVTEEMAQAIYGVLLQDACYVMGEA